MGELREASPPAMLRLSRRASGPAILYPGRTKEHQAKAPERAASCVPGTRLPGPFVEPETHNIPAKS